MLKLQLCQQRLGCTTEAASDHAFPLGCKWKIPLQIPPDGDKLQGSSRNEGSRSTTAALQNAVVLQIHPNENLSLRHPDISYFTLTPHRQTHEQRKHASCKKQCFQRPKQKNLLFYCTTTSTAVHTQAGESFAAIKCEI